VPGRARLLPIVAVAVLALGMPAAAQAADINVTTSTDESSGGNGCSLREAVIASNADSTGPGSDCIKGSGADVIHVPASATPYKLTNAGTPPEEAAATGDLDITDDVTIVGPGATKATVDGNKTDRVFDIHPGKTVEIRDLTIANGKTPDGADGMPGTPGVNPGDASDGNPGIIAAPGGGIRNDTATLTLTRVTLSGNAAGRGGNGGDASTGAVGAPNNAGGASRGGAGNIGGMGGGIANLSGTLTIESSRLVQNAAGEGGKGGAAGTGGTGGAGGGPGGLSWGGSGGAGGDGGAIYQIGNISQLTISDSVLLNNHTGAGGAGGAGGTGGTGGLQPDAPSGDGGGSRGGGAGRGGYGGAIEAARGKTSIDRSTLAGNSAGDGGKGGTSGDGGAAGPATGTTGTQGAGGATAAGGGGRGGGDGGVDLYNAAATTITRSTFANNSAGDGGDGGDAGDGGTGSSEGGSIGGDGGRGEIGGAGEIGGNPTTMRNVTVAGNHAGDGGAGGSAGSAGSGTGGPTTAGSGGNGADYGGPVIDGTGPADLEHLTIASNTFGTRGPAGSVGSGGAPGTAGTVGGIDIEAPTSLTSTILAYNSGGQCEGGPNASGHNISFPPTSSTCVVPTQADPKLSALGFHGGPTPTRTLLAGSSAIDTGGTGGSCLPTDQRGVTTPKGPACDVGAVERSLPSATTGDASSIRTTSAHVSGTVGSGQLPTTYRFQYGRSTAYGSQSSAGSTTTGGAVARTLTGLKPNTTYHYRLVATNPDGTVPGADKTFKTGRLPYAGATVVTKKAKVRKGRVKLKVRCSSTAAKSCTGTLRLTARVKKHTRKLGSRSFEIASGKSKVVTVKLTKSARKLLSKRKHLTATARTSSTDARGGKPVVRTRKVSLRS
jgi:CSLREA domain-containing protein